MNENAKQAKAQIEKKAEQLLAAMSIPVDFPGYKLFKMRIVSLAMDNYYQGRIDQSHEEIAKLEEARKC